MSKRGQIERSFEYVTPNGDMAEMIINFAFDYTRGTAHSHPGGHYNRASGSWDPPDSSDCDLIEVSRRDETGKWVPVPETDWLWDAWVRPTWDKLDDADFADATEDAMS